VRQPSSFIHRFSAASLLSTFAILSWSLGAFAQDPHAIPDKSAAQQTASAVQSGAVPCASADNLLRNARSRSHGVTGLVPRTTDGTLAEEGTFWSDPQAVVLPANSQLAFDMGGVQDLKAFVLQGDNNDEYVVEGSSDGVNYQSVWIAPATFVGMGLRTRSTVLDHPMQARYLRVTGRGGDGFFSVSEFQALCRLPAVFPPKLKLPPKKYGWDAIDNDVMVNVKGVVAIIGAVLLLAAFWRRLYATDLMRKPIALGVLALVTLGLAVAASWFAHMCTTGLGPWYLVRWARTYGSTSSFYAAAVLIPLLVLGSYGLRWYDARLRPIGVRVALCTLLFASAIALGLLGYMLDKNKGPEALLNIVKVHFTSPGLYYTGAMAGLTGFAVLALCLRKQGPSIFDTALAIVGLFSIFGWWNLGHYHFDHYVHIWEHYHYIMGAKYGPEIRYARLYQCTAVADTQDGLKARVKARKIRRIESDNELGTGDEILAHPELCTSHFTDPQRWLNYRADNRFFRTRFSADRWDESQNDHGYNATPVWAIVGRLIVDRTELTWDNIVRLSLIDSGFLIAMWLAVLWAFGWRAAAVAAIYWGTNFPARFYWNGGSFLRYDWQLWMVVGICFLRRRQHFLGGAALTYGSLLRVFPGFVVAALVLKALAGMVRERRVFLTKQHQRFAAGCVVTLLVLIPLSGWAMRGLDSWGEFAQNSNKHLHTALTNNMGLKTVMGYDFQTRAINMRNDKLEDPFKDWKDAKIYLYKTRNPFFLVLIVLFCIMLGRAGDREEDDWVAACLGTGLIVIAAELTCYYYGFLLTYGLLWGRRKMPGILAALLAAATCFLYDYFPWNDDQFAAMSLACVIVVVAVTAQSAFGRRTAVSDQTLPKRASPLSSPSASTPPSSMPPIGAEPHSWS
jgi:hypothetical protein